ncbi:hypothetical protein [Alteromonas stellipolaris]|uniref:Lipoprotein n=1 Tax=Alteromonas stellipolaris TaxID=233316 RepID=A0AAW7YY10_9ALTE|nr:hypothetical protein [Alteromonas stellipolaris]MDO6575908.1 hypothetical protein [Alteromonas stellipolaris]
MKWLLPISLLALYGCGGSTGDSNTTTPTPSSPPNLTIQGASEIIAGDSADFAVAAPSGTFITSVNWTVSATSASTQANNITPLASHTQAIGFDAMAAGEYLVSVTATFSSADSLTEITLTDELSLTVIEGQPPGATLRLGHEASEGGRVSLHVDNNSLKTVTDITWEQLSGASIPAFTFDDDDFSYNLYFQAPQVSADSIAEIQATLTFDDGSVATDTVQVLIKNINIDSDAYFVDDSGSNPETVTSHMLAYRPNSPYAAALDACVYNNELTSSCTFAQLPLIGQQTESPTIDDILDRTYVSHPWMGEAFEQFLQTSNSSEDLLQMLRATNAVVISYDIRPSFYWAVTGAIYLDANNFWRSPEERDTINTQPDYRSGFGSDLDFSVFWRYIKDAAYYYPQTGLAASARATRTQQGVDAALTWLMYHELAHANDFFDYTTWSSLSNSNTPLNYVNSNAPLSTGLENTLPLTSSELHALAQVRYGGDDANSTQRTYTAAQVANWFASDGAVTFYSYYTEREDFANLVERFMMLYRMDASADVAIFSGDAVDDGSYDVTWGQRDRINDSNLQLRVDYAVSRVLPELDIPAIQAAMPTPTLFPADSTWFNTVDLDNEESVQLTGDEKKAIIEAQEKLEERLY